MKLALLVCSFFVVTAAQAQIAFPYPMQPGSYQIQDTAKILDSTIKFAGFLQAQDWEMYNKIVKESREAYEALYGSCTANKCTGFNELRRISILTTKANTLVGVPVLDVVNAQLAYVSARDLLNTQLAAIQVTKDVWDGVVSSNQSEAVKTEYKKGALNLGKLADVYSKGIGQMESQAMKFQYKFIDGTGTKLSPENMGLEAPTATATAEVLKADLKLKQDAMSFTQQEQDSITAMLYNIVRQLVNFSDSAGQKFIFFTDGQQENNKGWIENIQNEARLLHWVRGNFCMPLGAPGVQVPREEAISQFTVFLTRDISKIFQPRQAVVRNVDDLRELRRRLERIFLSLQSQNGEFNSVGGVMSYVHRANATFSWHNQSAANLSVMKILRNMIEDEIDLQSFDPQGCQRVQARYNQAYGSFRDPAFMNVINRYLGGLIAGGAPEDVVKSFTLAGQAIQARGKIALEVKKYLKEHPAASPFGGLVDDDVK